MFKIILILLLISNSSFAADWLVKHPVITKMVELENLDRSRYNLPPLKLNTELSLLAQKHAQWMSDTGRYVHSNYGMAEIIHSGPTTVEGAITGWIYSPAHHRIMLSGSEVGCGYMVNNGITYWVSIIR